MINFLICCVLANVLSFGSLPSCPMKSDAQAAFQHLLHEVERDTALTYEEQQEKLSEFKMFAEDLSPKVASCLTSLLIQETRLRIMDILQNAGLDDLEITTYLTDYEEALLRIKDLNVELARQLLFFVAELKIHRQLVYDFGIALGCPEKQLLRHDLCKLRIGQLEGYAHYFRGGRQEEDKLSYLAAWELHQYEEHHHESYSKEGFDFDHFSDERLRNNMMESVADLLAATKQRGGSTLIDWLVSVFPKKNPHPRLLPFLKEALIKAHAFYLESEKKEDASSIFKGLPCWNGAVEEIFRNLERSGRDSL